MSFSHSNYAKYKPVACNCWHCCIMPPALPNIVDINNKHVHGNTYGNLILHFHIISEMKMS